MRKCVECDIKKSPDEFPVDKSVRPYTAGLSRYESCCKLCHRHARRMNKYGLTKHEAVAADAVTNCELCGAAGRRMVVDHDHETDKVRGTICDNCNRGLGLLGDNLKGAEAAVKYLSRHRDK